MTSAKPSLVTSATRSPPPLEQGVGGRPSCRGPAPRDDPPRRADRRARSTPGAHRPPGIVGRRRHLDDAAVVGDQVGEGAAGVAPDRGSRPIGSPAHRRDTVARRRSGRSITTTSSPRWSSSERNSVPERRRRGRPTPAPPRRRCGPARRRAGPGRRRPAASTVRRLLLQQRRRRAAASTSACEPGPARRRPHRVRVGIGQHGDQRHAALDRRLGPQHLGPEAQAAHHDQVGVHARPWPRGSRASRARTARPSGLSS